MSKTYMDSIIDTIQNAVWIVELNPRSPADPSASRIVHVNPAAAALFRCSRKSLIGRSLPDLVPPTSVNKGQWWGAVISGHDVCGIELDLIGPKHVEVPVKLVATSLPLRTDNSRHIVCVAQDMTQQRFAEHLLRENDRLTEQITALRSIRNGRLSGAAPNDE